MATRSGPFRPAMFRAPAARIERHADAFDTNPRDEEPASDADGSDRDEAVSARSGPINDGQRQRREPPPRKTRYAGPIDEEDNETATRRAVRRKLDKHAARRDPEDEGDVSEEDDEDPASYEPPVRVDTAVDEADDVQQELLRAVAADPDLARWMRSVASLARVNLNALTTPDVIAVAAARKRPRGDDVRGRAGPVRPRDVVGIDAFNALLNAPAPPVRAAGLPVIGGGVAPLVGMGALVPYGNPATGIDELLRATSPVLYAHACEAVSQLLLKLPALARSGAPQRIEPYIRDRDVRVSSLFARLVALRMEVSNTNHPSRQLLDATRRRIGAEEDALVAAFSGFRWNGYEFEERGLSDDVPLGSLLGPPRPTHHPHSRFADRRHHPGFPCAPLGDLFGTSVPMPRATLGGWSYWS